jgi:undecaprenyl pyrophosphate phosphatase UppP
MWWTVLIVTIVQGFWGLKLRNFVNSWGISYLPVIVIINYGVIALLIAQELGSRIVDSFN